MNLFLQIFLGVAVFVLLLSLFMVARINWLNSLNATQTYKRTLKKEKKRRR